MTTGIEIVASVIGIAGAGFKLSLILNAISCEIANAPYEIRAISKSVTLYSLLLKQTAGVLERGDSVHSQEALKTAEQVIEESHAVFNDINAMLDRVRTSKVDGSVSPTIPQRIRWCFKKHGIEYLLGRMDRLQMSLSLMLQIIALGTTMASTSRHDSPARVQEMTSKVQRERVEAQAIVIQFFQESQALRSLYMAAREEETEPTSPIEDRKHKGDSNALTLVTSQDSQLTVVEDFTGNIEKGLIVVSPYRDVIDDLGENWTKLGESKQDMVTHSDGIVTRLLERWTRWRERRDQATRQPRPKTSGRYNPVVQDWQDEEDDDTSNHTSEREDSPAGKYLEGPTTNWREPHSSEARSEAQRLRKAYRPYQPSVEGSSDVERSPSSNGSRKRPTKKHIIDSESESSSSAEEKIGEKTRPRRRSSAITVPQKPKQADSTQYATSRSYNPPSTTSQPRPPVNNGQTKPSISPSWSQYGAPQRPVATPNQNMQHHSVSSPPPNAYMHAHKQNTYPPPTGGPQPPTAQYALPNQYSHPYPPPSAQVRPPPPPYTMLSPQASRQGPLMPRQSSSRDGPPLPRPTSRDGKQTRSPSRLSREYSASDYRAYEEEKKKQRKETRRNLSDGAAKGILAGGGLAVFLEALDSLDL